MTQQVIVDAALKIEANEINWIRLHQTEIGVDKYLGLLDYLRNAADDRGVP